MAYKKFQYIPKGSIKTEGNVDLETQQGSNGLILICQCGNEIYTDPSDQYTFKCKNCGTKYMGPILIR